MNVGGDGGLTMTTVIFIHLITPPFHIEKLGHIDNDFGCVQFVSSGNDDNLIFFL